MLNNGINLYSELLFDSFRFVWVCLNTPHALEKNTEASKEMGLEVNADKTKYMVMSRDKNGRSNTIKIDNSSFERVEQFKYLGTTETNQNSIQVENKNRLKSGNACYRLVQNILYSSLPSENIRININTNIILSVVLYGCETWSLTLREDRRLRVLENRALRKIFGLKREEGTGEWRRLHSEELY